MTTTRHLLARRVDHGGHMYSLSLITIVRSDDGMWNVSIEPFERETAATPYHSGTAMIRNGSNPELNFEGPSPLPPKLILV